MATLQQIKKYIEAHGFEAKIEFGFVIFYVPCNGPVNEYMICKVKTGKDARVALGY